MRKKLAIVALIVLAFVVVISGCAGNQAGKQEEKPEPAVEVKNPDTISVVTIGNQDTLDPHFAYDTSSGEVIYNVYENLITYNKESIEEFLPLLATKVPDVENGLLSEDGKTYIFPIRQGVKFSNGNELTPEDVKYSFLRSMIQDREGGPIWMLYEPLFGPEISGFKALVSKITGKEIKAREDLQDLSAAAAKKVFTELEKKIEVDGDKVIFHLAAPYPPFMNVLAQGSYWTTIIDKEWSMEQGTWDGKAETIFKYHDLAKEEDPLYDKMMGTGPFILTSWENGQQVTFKRNDNYWREPANFKTAVIKSVDEWSTRKLMIQRGDADIVFVPNQYLDQVKDLDGVRVVEGYPRLNNTVGIMNWQINPKGNDDIGSGKLDGNGITTDFFADINVRKAFSYAFDYDSFIEEVRMGNAIRGRGPIVKPFIGYNESSTIYEYDLDKASEEFKKAFNGQLWEKGFKLTLAYNSGNDTRKIASDILKSNIEKINPKFKVTVRGVQWSTYLDNFLNGKFTLGVMSWGADFPDPHNFVIPYLASTGAFGANKGDKYTNWAEDNIDPLIKEGISTTDKEKRQEIYTKLQNIAIEQATDLWIEQPLGVHVERSWVNGWYPNPMRPGVDFYSLDK